MSPELIIFRQVSDAEWAMLCLCSAFAAACDRSALEAAVIAEQILGRPINLR